MKRQGILKIIIIVILIAALEAGIIGGLVSWYLKEQYDNRYDQYFGEDAAPMLLFFHENYQLFEDIKDGLIATGFTRVCLDIGGYVIIYDEDRNRTYTWVPGLSENGARFYEIAPSPLPGVCTWPGPPPQVRFSFYDSETGRVEWFQYSEGEPQKLFDYVEIEDNWYYHYFYGV